MRREPRNLHALLVWFREAWQAELSWSGGSDVTTKESPIHVSATDPGGDPDWNERFRAFMASPLDSGMGMTSEDAKQARSFPLHWHLRSMARGGAHGKRRARFLFVLVCQGYRVSDAARVISDAGHDEHGEQWVLDYAEASLRRLWRAVHDPERTHDDGRPRSFVQRRIHKSEAQSIAEGAADG